MKNKIKISSIFLLIIISMFMFVGCSNSTESSNDDIKKTKNVLNAARIMSDGSYQIRFSDLVELEALKEYNNETVTALGYLSPIMGYDGSFGYLMNLPYQTCPYCLPSDTKITNTIAIFTEKGKPIDFTEAAVLVKGTLKLEPYTDEYGYSYNYRMVDVTIEKADTSDLGEKITLYNKLAEKEILTKLMDTLYWVDENVFYDEYTANGAVYDRTIVDLTNLDAVINDLSEFNTEEVSILINTANKLKELTIEVNKLTENKEYEKIKEYKERTIELFYAIGDWMSIYEL
ncbi:MAG: hypothetical protein J6B87_06975 [Clostridia bacterium]|nr:hypothetical protein [Clostridia bacterium]